MRPPRQIDGADVIIWAWSEPKPFFDMPCSDGKTSVAIHGLAIVRYPETGEVYRFSCNAEWETENDSDHQTVEDAVGAEASQYDIRAVRWHQW